ncbi:MAG: hypothetical protein QXN37_00505 [Candidatus Anstonellaceae archaeon]
MAEDFLPSFAELLRQAKDLEKRQIQIQPSKISDTLDAPGSPIFPAEFEQYTAAYLLAEAQKVERKAQFEMLKKQQIVQPQPSDKEKIVQELTQFAQWQPTMQAEEAKQEQKEEPIHSPSLPTQPAVAEPPSVQEDEQKSSTVETKASQPKAQLSLSSKLSPRLRAIIEEKLRKEEEEKAQAQPKLDIQQEEVQQQPSPSIESEKKPQQPHSILKEEPKKQEQKEKEPPHEKSEAPEESFISIEAPLLIKPLFPEQKSQAVNNEAQKRIEKISRIIDELSTDKYKAQAISLPRQKTVQTKQPDEEIDESIASLIKDLKRSQSKKKKSEKKKLLKTEPAVQTSTKKQVQKPKQKQTQPQPAAPIQQPTQTSSKAQTSKNQLVYPTSLLQSKMQPKSKEISNPRQPSSQPSAQLKPIQKPKQISQLKVPPKQTQAPISQPISRLSGLQTLPQKQVLTHGQDEVQSRKETPLFQAQSSARRPRILPGGITASGIKTYIPPARTAVQPHSIQPSVAPKKRAVSTPTEVMPKEQQPAEDTSKLQKVAPSQTIQQQSKEIPPADLPPDDDLEIPKPPPEETELQPSSYQEAKEEFRHKIEAESIKEKTKEEYEAMLEQYAKENMIWLYEIYSMGGIPKEDFLQKVKEKLEQDQARSSQQQPQEAPSNPAFANLNREIDKRYKK